MRTVAGVALASSMAFFFVNLARAASSTVISAESSQPGPLAVATGEYKFPAKIDAEVLTDAETELWARAFWPKNLGSKRHPILFLLHGNHSTCEDRSESPYEENCSYTYKGTCPLGSKVVANHEGYNYLGEHLASWGYIVVSINANRGINCGSGNVDDEGLNLARGRLILRHIEQWFNWSTNGGAPAQLGLPANAFRDSIDIQNVGLFGHSRGGEGARAAYNLYRDVDSPWPTRVPGLEIRGIYEIGAIDGQTSRVLDADDTAWNQLLPMCDGDVSDLRGRRPFERMILKTAESRKTPKSLYMVWGTNHNFFNTEWHENDSLGCAGHKPIHSNGPLSTEQQKIAIASASAFFRAHVGTERDPNLAQHFDPLYALPSFVTSITHIDRDYIRTFDEAYSARIEDFSGATGKSSTGHANLASGIAIDHDANALPKCADISWQTASSNNFFQVNWAAEGQGRSVAAFDTLDFRIGRDTSHYNDITATDFTVQLVDRNGALSQGLPVSRFAEILGPASIVSVYQTVRVPLREFGWPSSTEIRGVRFTFDRSRKAAIKLAHIRFSSGEVAALLASLETPLPQLTPKYNENSFNNDEDFNEFDAKISLPVLQGGGKIELSKAEVSSVAAVASSPYAQGKPTVEISVHTADKFRAEMNLPTLVIAERGFAVSRYPISGRLDTLIFTIPLEDFNKLPNKAKMRIQYGKAVARKIWKMPDFDKKELQP